MVWLGTSTAAAARPERGDLRAGRADHPTLVHIRNGRLDPSSSDGTELVPRRGGRRSSRGAAGKDPAQGDQPVIKFYGGRTSVPPAERRWGGELS